MNNGKTSGSLTRSEIKAYRKAERKRAEDLADTFTKFLDASPALKEHARMQFYGCAIIFHIWLSRDLKYLTVETYANNIFNAGRNIKM